MWLALLFEGYDFALKCRDVEERRRMVQCALDGEPPKYVGSNKEKVAAKHASKIFGEEVGALLASMGPREEQLKVKEQNLERATAHLRGVLGLNPNATAYAIERAASERFAQGLGPEVSEVLRKVSYLLEDVARGASPHEIGFKAGAVAEAAEALVAHSAPQ